MTTVQIILISAYIVSGITSYFFIRYAYKMVPERHKDVIRPELLDFIALFTPAFNIVYGIGICISLYNEYKSKKDFYEWFFGFKREE